MCSRNGIAVIVAQPNDRFAAGWDRSDCGTIYQQVCRGMGIAVIVGFGVIVAPSSRRCAVGWGLE